MGRLQQVEFGCNLSELLSVALIGDHVEAIQSNLVKKKRRKNIRLCPRDASMKALAACFLLFMTIFLYENFPMFNECPSDAMMKALAACFFLLFSYSYFLIFLFSYSFFLFPIFLFTKCPSDASMKALAACQKFKAGKDFMAHPWAPTYFAFLNKITVKLFFWSKTLNVPL